MALRSLTFYFDYLSPYSYLAWTQLPALARAHGLTVEPVPVLLAALLGAHGHKGPAEIPSKRLYVIKEVARRAHRLGVTLDMPPAHPFNPLLGLRVSSIEMPLGQRCELVTGLFAEVWGGGRGIEEETVVADVATTLGYEGQRLVAEASNSDTKRRLRAQTEKALELGAFGVPTMVVDEELFWGLDSLPDVERFLQGNDPVEPSLVERWESLPATAKRRVSREA